MDIPSSLHGQLYLLDFDPRWRRFHASSLLGYAAAAAMLTDLQLTGHLVDHHGIAHAADGVTAPADPLLRSVLTRITRAAPKDWHEWILDDAADAPRLVREQLTADRWLRARHRTLRTGGPRPTDEDIVDHLRGQVTAALRNALHGAPASHRPLAVALLGALGQLPALRTFTDHASTRRGLRDLTQAAIEPIAALHDVITTHHDGLRGLGGSYG